MTDAKLTYPNPRRILLVGAPGSGKLTFLRALTGSFPTLPTATVSHAGLSHTLALETSYYSAAIPIWIDELPPARSDGGGGDGGGEGGGVAVVAEWAAHYLSPPAKEVLAALGSFVLTFRHPATAEAVAHVRESLAELAKVVAKCGYAWDGCCLAVAMPSGQSPRVDVDWEAVCMAYGFEYVDFEKSGERNEFGEPEGVERVKEALEACDWAGDDGDGEEGLLDELEELDGDGEGEEEEDVLKPVRDEMEREMFGLHSAIVGEDGNDDDDEELQVEKLEATMAKLQALKDLGDGVSMGERRKLAAKAIQGIMKS